MTHPNAPAEPSSKLLKLDDVTRVAVVGVGQMGRGIALVCARAGYEVSLCDVDRASALDARQRIASQLARLVGKNKLTGEEATGIERRLLPCELEAGVGPAQLVIEAVSEEPRVKLALFEELDRLAPPGALLCSNTSSISITRIAASTRRPELVEGVHFMNPVPTMQLVELIRGWVTADTTHELLCAFARKIGKTVVTSQDHPGFIVNRILIPMLNEACFAAAESVASVEDIDLAIRLGLNHPMGPFRLADLIGLDTVLSIAEVLHRDLGDDKYRPAVLLRNLVAAGHLGVKSGRGFYVYEGDTPPRPAF